MHVELEKVKRDVDNFTFCFENERFRKQSRYLVTFLKDEQIKKREVFSDNFFCANDFKS